MKPNKQLWILLIIGLLPIYLHGQSCNCKEYIYLNEPLASSVLKFEVGDPVLLTEIPGPDGTGHWYPGSGTSELPSPHGLATDLNGYLYIAATGGNSDIRRFDCAGNLQPATPNTIFDPGSHTNMFSIGNTLYTNNQGQVASFDLCSGASLGQACLNQMSSFNWGVSYNETLDLVYVSGQGFAGEQKIWVFTRTELENSIANGTCIDPFIPAGTDGTINVGDSYIPNNFNDVMGITSDNDGNIYVTATGGGTSKILKYDPNGLFLGETTQNSTLFATQGLIWSETNNRLYVASYSDDPNIDCIAVYDATTLAYLGTGAPNPNSDTENNTAKTLAINKECCPNPSNIVIDTLLCDMTYPTNIFLQDFIDCDGIICEGSWTPDAGNIGIDYNDCNNSITINSVQACGSFNLFGDGTNATSQCGQFSITINIETATTPTVSITGDQNLCPSDTPTDLVATSPTVGVTYQWQMSTTSCTDGFTDITGATTNTYTPPVTGQTTYYQVITSTAGDCASGMCEAISNCVTVTSDNCAQPDIRLGKTVDTDIASLGQTVTFTLTVYNDGTEELTNIEVTDVLPTGLIYTGDNSGGSYNSGTGLWTIPSIAIGDSAIIEIMATMDIEGVIINSAEITAADQLSLDPNITDNIDNACVSVPIQVCDNETINVELAAAPGLTMYQWYKDGVAIAGATTETYNATETGTYTYTVDGAGPTGNCQGELCCPVIIEQVSCCPPVQCIPIQVTKLEE